MEEANLKRTGIMVLIYSVLGAGIVNFALWLRIAMGMGIAEMVLWAYYLFGLLTATLLISFICSLTGGIVLIGNKKWGKKVALFGIFFSVAHVFLFILFLLPNIIKPWGFTEAIPLLLALSYLFFLVGLRHKIRSSELIDLKNWKILGFIVCTVFFMFFLFRILTVVSKTESPIDNNSSLSSNGESIVFSMDDDLYAISMKGEGLKRLTSNPAACAVDPRFSVDGKMICFVRHPIRTFQQIRAHTIPYYSHVCIANADGSNEHKVCGGSNPTFSPDGKKILFTGPGSIDNRTCEINIDGTGFRELGPYLMSLVYSPDGKSVHGLENEYLDEETYKLDFERRRQAAEHLKINIVKIDLDTLEQHIIGGIPREPEKSELKFSPEAKKILFINLAEEDKLKSGKYLYQIYIADIDGSSIRKLTNDLGPKHQPTFTQDGSKIIFIHEEPEYGGKRSIKIMDLDGSNIKTLFQR